MWGKHRTRTEAPKTRKKEMTSIFHFFLLSCNRKMSCTELATGLPPIILTQTNGRPKVSSIDAIQGNHQTRKTTREPQQLRFNRHNPRCHHTHTARKEVKRVPESPSHVPCANPENDHMIQQSFEELRRFHCLRLHARVKMAFKQQSHPPNTRDKRERHAC